MTWRVQFWLWRVRRAWAMLREDCAHTDGDWTAIVYPLRHAIRRTRLHVAEHRHVVDWERMCHEMLIAETLLTRLIDDVYYDNATARYPAKGRTWLRRIDELEKQDMALLTETLRKHLRGWWD